MKRTSKMVGAVALSAALALGTAVPAFAASGEEEVTPATENGVTLQGKDMVQGSKKTTGGESGGVKKEGEALTFEPISDASGSSTVRVLSKVTQISATVPVMVYVVADAAGGDLLAVPSGTGAALGTAARYTAAKDDAPATGGNISYRGYRIENNSNVELYVTKVVADDAAASGEINGAWKYETDDTDIAASPVDTAGGKVGNIHLKVQPYATGEGFIEALRTADFSTTDGIETFATDTGFLNADGRTQNSTAADYADKATISDKLGTVFPIPKKPAAVGDTTTGKVNWAIEPAVYTAGTNDAFTPGVLGLELSGKTSRVFRTSDVTFSNLADAYGTGAVEASGIGDIKLIYTVSATEPTA